METVRICDFYCKPFENLNISQFMCFQPTLTSTPLLKGDSKGYMTTAHWPAINPAQLNSKGYTSTLPAINFAQLNSKGTLQVIN